MSVKGKSEMPHKKLIPLACLAAFIALAFVIVVTQTRIHGEFDGRFFCPVHIYPAHYYGSVIAYPAGDWHAGGLPNAQGKAQQVRQNPVFREPKINMTGNATRDGIAFSPVAGKSLPQRANITINLTKLI
jgi:hypothetical protein